MKIRHMYYSDPVHINLAALQATAITARNEGNHVIIHHHAHGKPCGSVKHEDYPPLDEKK